MAKIDDVILTPLINTSKRFYAFVGALLVMVALGAFAWSNQLTTGLIVTGMNIPVYWGGLHN